MPQPPRTSRAAIAAALLAIYFCWGSTYIGIRFAIDSMPPFSMAAARFLAAGLVLFAFARLRGSAWPSRRHWLSALVLGGLLLTIGNGAVVWAEEHVPTGLVAVVVCTSAVWMVAFDRVLNGTRVRWPQVLGVAIGVVGIAVLANPTAAGASLPRVVVLLGSSLSWGLGTVLSRRLPLPASASLGSGMEMLAGGALLWLPALAFAEPTLFEPSRVTATSLVAVGYLAVFGSLVAFSSFLWLVRVAPVALVATQSYVSPVVAVLLGVLLRGERLTAREVVAGVIILAAVVLIVSTPVLVPRREELPAAA